MRTKDIFQSLILVMMFLFPFAYGKEVYVDDDGPADFDNIQAGIDAADQGDTVLVAPGQYVVSSPIIFRGKALTVRAKFGPEETTIRISDSPDDLNRASVVVFENGETETTVLEGFTISGGKGCWWEYPTVPGTFYQVGGGIFCTDSSPTITDCIISDNHTILRNKAQDIGGGVTLVNSSAVMTRCTIRNNTTSYWAGGVYIFNDSPTMTDCVIFQNSVLHQDGQAGGLNTDCDGLSDSKPLILRCMISANSSEHAAGGVQISSGSQPTFIDCLISDNRSGAIGGILSSYSSVTTLKNCIITRNSAERSNGGLGCGHHAEAILNNCTITGNTAGSDSGGVLSYDNSVITVRNCIIFGNTAPVGPEIGFGTFYKASMNISYSNIGGGLSSANINQGCTLNWGQGNIDADPLFADPGKGDFHVQSEAGRWDPNSEIWVMDSVTSPCIDAGDPNTSVAFEPYPNGIVVNMGAYGGTKEASKSPTGLHARYSGGTGEPKDPYQIATFEDLMLLGETPEDYDKHFILTADIDLDPNLPSRKVFDRAVIAPHTGPNEWYPEFQGTPFTGVFDGQGHTISHLTIRGGSYLGLFGQLGSGGSPAGGIRNLGLVDVNIIGTGTSVGGLVGHNFGVMGGNFSHGSIDSSYSSGSVCGGYAFTGGLVGTNVGELTGCHSTCAVDGESDVGGLAGGNGGTVTRCYSTSMVTGTEGVGGFVGNNWGTVTQCYGEGSVSGDSQVGGLVGCNTTNLGYMGIVAQCYSTETVSGYDDVGGLVGFNLATVTQCYSTGAVSGTGADRRVGGLVGLNVWFIPPGGTVIRCFWDVNASGQTVNDGGTGKTTAEMKMASTFLEAGWDFLDETANGTEDIWWINEGNDYPRLWWELISNETSSNFGE